jgi:glycosyltransferase involved in cell wall biosynthesis
VHLLGDRTDVPRLMPQFDVLALASRTEGLPMVLLEAMASGVPCVATAVGGIPALLTDGAGELVAAGDVEGFAAALGRYVCDERQRRQAGMSARERVLAGYRECDMIEDYARELATA